MILKYQCLLTALHLSFSSSDVYKSNKLVSNFSELLANIFMPMFEVTRDPSSHPDLHKFLKYVSSALVNSCTTNCPPKNTIRSNFSNNSF